MGNAVERLGIDVIGLRTIFLHEAIFQFVYFGYGCDFKDDSTLLVRVSTISMFSEINITRLYSEQKNPIFNRGSFYFRETKWEIEEMVDIMFDIADRCVLYYFSKYSKDVFTN